MAIALRRDDFTRVLELLHLVERHAEFDDAVAAGRLLNLLANRPSEVRSGDITRTAELLRLIEIHGDVDTAQIARRLADILSEQLAPLTIVITDTKTCN